MFDAGFLHLRFRACVCVGVGKEDGLMRTTMDKYASASAATTTMYGCEYTIYTICHMK